MYVTCAYCEREVEGRCGNDFKGSKDLYVQDLLPFKFQLRYLGFAFLPT